SPTRNGSTTRSRSSGRCSCFTWRPTRHSLTISARAPRGCSSRSWRSRRGASDGGSTCRTSPAAARLRPAGTPPSAAVAARQPVRSSACPARTARSSRPSCGSPSPGRLPRAQSSAASPTPRRPSYAARSPDDYGRVYGTVLQQVSRPVILHWLGSMFDPELAGYWGTRDLDEAMEVCLEIIREHRARIDGIKISLLDAEREVALRARLP